jgi:hypothetical protein
LEAFLRPREAIAAAILRIFFRTAAASSGGKCDSRLSAESTINLRTFCKSDFTTLVMDRSSPIPELSGSSAQNKAGAEDAAPFGKSSARTLGYNFG